MVFRCRRRRRGWRSACAALEFARREPNQNRCRRPLAHAYDHGHCFHRRPRGQLHPRATGNRAGTGGPTRRVSAPAGERADKTRGFLLRARSRDNDPGRIRSLVLQPVHFLDLAPDSAATSRRGSARDPASRRRRRTNSDARERPDVDRDDCGFIRGGACGGRDVRDDGARAALGNWFDEGARSEPPRGQRIFCCRAIVSCAGRRRCWDTRWELCWRARSASEFLAQRPSFVGFCFRLFWSSRRSLRCWGVSFRSDVPRASIPLPCCGESEDVASRSMFLRILWKLLGASRGRLAVALIALTSGAAVCSALLNVNLDAERKLTQEFRTLGANVVIAPPAGGSEAALADAVVLDRIAALRLPQIVATAPYLYVAANSGSQPVILAGTWFDQVAKMNSWWKLEGGWVTSRDDHEHCLVGLQRRAPAWARARQFGRAAFRRSQYFTDGRGNCYNRRRGR